MLFLNSMNCFKLAGKFIAGSAICFVSGCAYKQIPLELVPGLRVTTTNTTLLKLKGVYVDSSFAVGKTHVERISGNILLIRVLPRLPSRHTSSQINVEVVIDDSVDAVAFGDRDSIVWRRNGRNEKPSADK